MNAEIAHGTKASYQWSPKRRTRNPAAAQTPLSRKKIREKDDWSAES